MGKKFKIGDKVRYIDPNDNGSWIEIQVCEGWEGTIVKKFDLNDGCDGYWNVEWDRKLVNEEHEDNLELVSRTSEDPKTAFLNDLKELLIKYDADISACQSDFEEVTLALNIGDDAIEYGYRKGDNSVKVTPSNIFDYDK